MKIGDKIICISGNGFVIKVFRGTSKYKKEIYNYDEFGNEIDVRTVIEERIFYMSFLNSNSITGWLLPPRVYDEKIWEQIEANIKERRRLWKENEELFKQLKQPKFEECERIRKK